MARSEGVTVQSVLRALEIIESLSGSQSELGITEIAEFMQLSKSTVYGLVNTLVIKGYLEQNAQTKRYRLGLKLFEIGTLVHRRMDLRNEAKPYCEELSFKYNATVHLAAYSNNEIVYIDKVDMPSAIIIYSQVGKRAPMYCTGVGKAVLAFLNPEKQQEFIENLNFERYTDNTIIRSDDLERELQKIRSQGFAFDNEEIEVGLRCIAAPIFNHKSDPIAAISVSAPIARLAIENIDQIAQNVVKCAKYISARLGAKN